MHVEYEDATEAYPELVHLIQIIGIEEPSRNGDVLTVPDPFTCTIRNPTHRVLRDPIRDANPFFHLFEFVWMVAGSNELEWITHFNNRLWEYSDDGKTHAAAYGHRWRNHFGHDQLVKARDVIRADHTSRRAVIGMWDPRQDLGGQGKDLPCNTQIMLRVVHGRLDMLVTNRSNDLIWGMMGANIVHMTMLHELLALDLELPVGRYTVVTNNLHVYKGIPKPSFADLEKYRGAPVRHPMYPCQTFPLLAPDEWMEEFFMDATKFLAGRYDDLSTEWFRNVALPMFRLWQTRDLHRSKTILAEDWRVAGEEWVKRRVASQNLTP